MTARKMKDSGIEWIGEIPESWQFVPVQRCFTEVKRKNTDGLVQNALKFKFGTIIPKENFDADDDVYVADTITSYTVVEPGTVMINGLNLNYDLKSQRTALVRETGVITSAYLALWPKRDLITPEYSTYLFKGYETKMALHNMGAGIRLTLGWKEFKKQPVLLPPLPEQQRIADYLDRKCAEIDRVAAETEKTIEEYKVLKQSIITEAVTKGVRGKRKMKDSGIEWIGEIPEEWKVGKIKYCTTKIGSGKTPKGGADVYADSGILFIRSQNVYDEGLHLEDPTYITDEVDAEMAGTRVNENDVLLNITGGSIGRSCIMPKESLPANVNQHVSIIRVISKTVLPEIMHYFWMSSIGKTSINIYQTGGNREGMSADAIANTPFLFYGLPEQREIADYLDAKCAEIDRLVAAKQDLLAELATYKKSVIYEYVTGKKEAPSCR